MNKNAKEKLIEASYAFMLTKGYSSTSVDELCESAGVSKGSFYHFFKSKEELGLALLDDFFAKARVGFLGGQFRSYSDPLKKVFGFLDHTDTNSENLWGNGCLLGAFAADLAGTNEVIRQKVSDILASVVEEIAKIFEPLSEMHPENKLLDANRLAESFVVTIEGAVVLCKAHHDLRFLERALVNFRENLEAQIK